MDSPNAELFAQVNGETLAIPQDLYIPPDALEIFLETFEGPLDLLLYLIKRQNLDITNLPIADITRQYMDYLAVLQGLRLELAAEYLVMAAMLAEIKSRLLIPRPVAENEFEEDPRAELVRRLQEYERFRVAAEALDDLPRLQRDLFTAVAELPFAPVVRASATVQLDELLNALRDVMQRAAHYSHHAIKREPLSVRERMSQLLETLDTLSFTPLTELFTLEEGRLGVVVTFLAVLELLREAVLDLVQAAPFAPIHVRLRS
jgi:segregation and condensation protein A